jgi:hypothetical protein
MQKMSGSRWTQHIHKCGLEVEGYSVASSVTGLQSDGICLSGHLKENVYTSLPMTIENIVARLQSNVTTVDAIVLRHVGDSTACYTAFCLKRLWFDRLNLCDLWWWRVSCKLNVAWNTWCSYCFGIFLTKNMMNSLCANFISLCNFSLVPLPIHTCTHSLTHSYIYTDIHKKTHVKPH